MRKMIPAAWSSFPEIGLNRTVAIRSAYSLFPRRIEGKSAVAVWQSACGADGASASARTSQAPENTTASAKGFPAASLSKFHSSVSPAVALASLAWNLTCGVPLQPATAATKIATPTACIVFMCILVPPRNLPVLVWLFPDRHIERRWADLCFLPVGERQRHFGFARTGLGGNAHGEPESSAALTVPERDPGNDFFV